MRITECVHPNYFIVDGRTLHEISLVLLEVRGLLENYGLLEEFRGEYIREQAYALEGAEAVAVLSNNIYYKIDEEGGIVAGKNFEFSEFDIPDGVKIIRKSAFQGLSCLNSVTIPGSVKVIEEDAFNSCINLKKVTFNDGLQAIRHRAFAKTSLCEPIYLPESVTEISHCEVFPRRSLFVYVSYSLSSACRSALSRCGLILKYI